MTWIRYRKHNQYEQAWTPQFRRLNNKLDELLRRALGMCWFCYAVAATGKSMCQRHLRLQAAGVMRRRKSKQLDFEQPDQRGKHWANKRGKT